MNDRVDKLDSLFLFILEVLAFVFSLTIVVFEPKQTGIFFIPLFILIFFPIYIGYIRGAIIDNSPTERIMGWILFLFGIATYIYFSGYYLLCDILPKNLKQFEDLFTLPFYWGSLFFGFMLRRFAGSISKIFEKIFEHESSELRGFILEETGFASICFGFSLGFIFLSLHCIMKNQVSELSFSITVSLVFFILFLYTIKKLLTQAKLEFQEYEKYIRVSHTSYKKKVSILGAILTLFGLTALPISYYLELAILAKILFLLILNFGAILVILSGGKSILKIKEEQTIPKEIEKELRKLLEQC